MQSYDDVRIELEALGEFLGKSTKPYVVFTNGCFDILHGGHLDVLKRCRQLMREGAMRTHSYVVVGLNSDDSVRRLKGSARPIMGADDRAEILMATRYVDYVVEFDEDLPDKLIQALKPDVVVKGGDWKSEQVAHGCKQVVIVPTRKGISTTEIVGKILRDESKSAPYMGDDEET